MARYVAFLRAINVGGHVVKMDALRRLFEDMGFTQVETFIASGNVIFESDADDPHALEATISAELRQALGYEVAAFLRTAEELAELASYPAFPANAAAAVYVGFAAAPLGAETQQKVLAFRTAVDEFVVHGREIYWLCRVRSSDSAFSLAKLEKATGIQATFRNLTTVRKMAEKYGE